MYILLVPEIFYCVLVDALIGLLITEGCAPPEPASCILMEWSEQNCAIYLMCIVSYHVQISTEGFIVCSSGQNLIHHITCQKIGCITAEVIACIADTCVISRFGYSTEIRHMQ